MRYVRWFDELSLADVPSVGGKNASLGELVRSLGDRGVRTAPGFAITADGFRRVIDEGGLAARITRELTELDKSRLQDLSERGRRIRDAVLSAPLPRELVGEIVEAYRALTADGGGQDVAVRSSATAEDLPDASFAGQQESFLNVHGERNLLNAYQACLASLFTDRAISYRIDKGFDHDAVAISVGVQRMVRSDRGAAGVAFTLDTESGFRDVVLISSSWGLGESVVKGRVDPDEFLVHKPTLRKGYRSIVKRSIGAKQEKLVYSSRGASTRAVAVSPEARSRASLSDDDVLTLARWALIIEEHYSARAGRSVPMDVEWAKDGRTGELFIVQARPETIHAQGAAKVETYRLGAHGPALLTGRSVGQRIGLGPVRQIHTADDLATFAPGEVLVASMTDPDWEPAMKMAAAIVTDRGGRTCHAAIVSRELGVPCIVGAERATSTLTQGRTVTVSCAEGEVGSVYDGAAEFTKAVVDPESLPRTRTRVLMNVASPEQAFRLSSLPNDGVGLARIEFIVSSLVKVHPMALVHPDRVPAGPERDEIERLVRNERHPTDYFVDRLAEGVARIAAAFYPKDVIVRMSDFKTNEYAHLLGGSVFEPEEENPMLGFRGASRYHHPRYREGFLLECRAMKKVREEMGLVNVKLMIPFCRTVDEARKVVELMAEAGLERGKDGLQIWMMCEIPANVVLAEDFAELFDGFSIGSNDLTQLVLGVDRDSEVVAPLFDERNPAVYKMVDEAIRKVHARGRKIGICGQAPSDYPEFAEFVVAAGIDSVSLNPDTVMRTIPIIARAEEKAAKRP